MAHEEFFRKGKDRRSGLDTCFASMARLHRAPRRRLQPEGVHTGIEGKNLTGHARACSSRCVHRKTEMFRRGWSFGGEGFKSHTGFDKVDYVGRSSDPPHLVKSNRLKRAQSQSTAADVSMTRITGFAMIGSVITN